MRWRNNPLSRKPTLGRFGLAMLAGLMIPLALPKWEIAGLAWIAPGALLLASAGAPKGLGFRLGYAGGLACYLAALYWLLLIPMPWVPILGWIALALYLAVYPALWVWLSWKFFPAPLPAAPWPFDPMVAEAFRRTSWLQRTVWCLQVAALWTGLEIILGRFLTGFPWMFLGVTQYKMLPLIQVSEYTGVYGVSFLIVWFSSALLCCAFSIARHPAVRGAWAKEIALPFLAMIAAVLHGFGKLKAHEAPEFTLTATLIQPSIPQTLIWDPAENESRFRQLMALSEASLEAEPELVIWPEASVPNMLRYHEETGLAIRRFVTEHDVWAIIGSDDAEVREGLEGGERTINYFNSAFAISPGGKIAGVYKKRRLVIFGEYVPFVEQLPFLSHFSPAGETGFTPGTKPVPFSLDSLDVITSVLICFEDVFPHLVRGYVRPGTDFLVNLTNNGWFGESAAQWQHAAAAAFRAVENRIPLVRCANNGLTCWVDELGRMHEVYFPGSRDVYQAGYKVAEIPVLAPGARRQLTFYTRQGDVFGWTCLALAGLSLAGRAFMLRSR